MRKRPLCFTCLLFILVQALILIVTSGSSLYDIPASSVFGENEERTVWIEGQVYKKANTSNSQVLYLKNNSITDQNQSFTDSRIIIYGDNFTEIPLGKSIKLKGYTGFFEEARNPGNFDQALYYARQRIYGYVRCEEVLAVSGQEDRIKSRLYDLKCSWKERIMNALEEENGAILSAMLLGEKSEMDEEIKELYQKNGIAHILAISGLHISFIGLGVYKLIRRMGLNYTCSGVIAILVLSLYAMMIGFSVSVVRAYVMLLLRIGADMTGRVYDMITALFLAAALTIGYQPLYLTDGGFYMSYGAILGILLVLPVLEKSIRCKWKWIAGCLSGIAINIMLFPILLFFYFEFPTYSILLNMLVIPLMSLVLGFGMIGSFFLFLLPIIGQWFLKVCEWILDFYEWLSRLGSQLPASQLVLGKPEIWEILMYYALLAMILFFFYCDKRQRNVRFRGFAWVTIGIAIAFMGHRPNGMLEVTMLDVGQGDGIVIRGPQGVAYLIDGGSSDVEKLGKYRIEPYLKSQGIGTLDYVFLTHGDADHYSGIAEMLERQSIGVKIENLVLPVNFKEDEALCEMAMLAGENGVRVVNMQGGKCVTEGEMKITCLQPVEEENSLIGNAGSMVLELEYGDFTMLCTGDVELEGERRLIQRLNGRDYDVLKVAHHGSKNSTTENFLKAVKPKIALISVGEDNSYGHPHSDTIDRLKKAGCKVCLTKENGAIMLSTDGNSLTISSLPFRL